jgi:hypothetical protein
MCYGTFTRIELIKVRNPNSELGGTKGDYSTRLVEFNEKVQTGAQITMDQIYRGTIYKPFLNAPFTRFSEDVEKYPDFIGDIDDVFNKSYEHFDRFKYFDPKKGSTVGQHFWLPRTDDDTKLIWGDTDGDTPFSDPPDPNIPAVDHGLDEDNLWNFNRTPYN